MGWRCNISRPGPSARREIKTVYAHAHAHKPVFWGQCKDYVIRKHLIKTLPQLNKPLNKVHNIKSHCFVSDLFYCCENIEHFVECPERQIFTEFHPNKITNSSQHTISHEDRFYGVSSKQNHKFITTHTFMV